jgi:FHA domain
MTTDYCDRCGEPITVTPAQPTEILAVVEDPDTSTSTSPAARRDRCPVCDTERSGQSRYCEACGHDFLAPTSGGTAWVAIVDADPAWFERSSSTGLTFPAGYRQQRLTLAHELLRIGRSQGGADEDAPELPLEDPGASRKHAVLERQGDGGYTVTDVGSTNGTYINYESTPLAEGEPVRLAPDDKIQIGAWTTITLRTGPTP